MKDSELPDYCGILEADIDDLRGDYNQLFHLGLSFLAENCIIDENNKLKHDVLYRNLGNFYRLVVNTSRIDLGIIAFQERLAYAEKKHFAEEVKDYLREMLVDLEDLRHPEEESPFYERRDDL